jgi:hypothetical protein
MSGMKRKERFEASSASTRSLCPKRVLVGLVDSLFAHYKKNLVPLNDSSVMSEYFLVDMHENWHLLPAAVKLNIDRLMHKRIPFFEYTHNGMTGKVDLHPYSLHDGFPLIVFTVNGEQFAIKHKDTRNKHLHLFRFQPKVLGMSYDEGEIYDLQQSYEFEQFGCYLAQHLSF